jgi:hydrogenase maturation factor
MIDADGNVRHQEEDHQMLMLSRGKWRSIGNVRRRGLAVEH